MYKIKSIGLLAFVIFMSGCIDIEENIIEYEEIILLDTLDSLDRSGGTIMSNSSINKNSSASMFEVTKTSQITNIKWSGKINNQVDEATFYIRIFEGESLPEEPEIKELVIVADVTKVEPYDHYIFEYNVTEDLVLEEGRYWLSVLDPETEGISFLWTIERDKNSTQYGSGGAFKSSPIDSWQSLGSGGITAVEARGRSLFIQAIVAKEEA